MFTVKTIKQTGPERSTFLCDITHVETGDRFSAEGATEREALTAARDVIDAATLSTLQTVANGADLVLPT